MSVNVASCCLPVPGDAIIGCVTTRRGITVHREDCKNTTGARENVSVSWGIPALGEGKLYETRIRAEGADRADLLSDATRAITQEGVGIKGIKATMVGNSLMRMKIELCVKNVAQLYAIMGKLNEVRGILSVTRG